MSNEKANSLIDKLCHIAINYVVFLREPIPETRLVGSNLLAKALHTSWSDCIEADPKLRARANRVVRLVRCYRGGKITLERAVSQIIKMKGGIN
jgi:hypothetical protein